MTVTIQRALRDYQVALRRWLANDGLSGGGGNWSRETRKHDYAHEPQPAEFGIAGQFELRAAAGVKESEHARKNPRQ